MKLLLEKWKGFLNENVVYVSIDKLLPTEEMGHGKDHDCPSEDCEEQVQMKMNQIESGIFEPIQVCNQKPVVTARLSGEQDYTSSRQNQVNLNRFLYVLDGHHRLEAAKRLGLDKVPVVKVQK